MLPDRQSKGILDARHLVLIQYGTTVEDSVVNTNYAYYPFFLQTTTIGEAQGLQDSFKITAACIRCMCRRASSMSAGANLRDLSLNGLLAESILPIHQDRGIAEVKQIWAYSICWEVGFLDWGDCFYSIHLCNYWYGGFPMRFVTNEHCEIAGVYIGIWEHT